MSYTLYALICPNTNIIRYIGITKQKLKKRLYGHLTKQGDNPHKDNWIASLKKEGEKPLIEGLYFNLTKTQACEIEIETIKKYKTKLGKKLTNILPGGNIPPDNTGKKRFFTELHKKKISKSCKGRKAHNKGKKLSLKQRKKLSIARKKINNTPEWKAKRKTWSVARIKIKLVNPNGEIYNVDNIYEFCLKHNLQNSCVYKMIKGKTTQHKGWHLYGVSPKKPISATVIDKNNEVFHVNNVPNFCKNHNLDLSAFYKLINGAKDSYKGWRLAPSY